MYYSFFKAVIVLGSIKLSDGISVKHNLAKCNLYFMSFIQKNIKKITNRIIPKPAK